MESIFGDLKTYEEFRNAIGVILSGDVAMDEADAVLTEKPPVNERFIQNVWRSGCVRTQGLTTASGKPLEIKSAGRWNDEAGPDFIGSEIVLGGKSLKGDVEIHVNASDWRRHQHDRNFEFNKCILHAALHLDDGKSTDHLFNGKTLERLHLEPALIAPLEELRQTMSADEYHYRDEAELGECAPFFRKMPPRMLGRFLDLAGDRRVEEKARRLEDQISGEDENQVLYQALMTAMGHKGSKTLFFLLSKRAPIAELLDHAGDRPDPERVMIMQSILFNVANLVPSPGEKKGRDPDAETIGYLNELNKWWARFSGYFSDRIMPRSKKWFAGVRPVNFATRRMGGVARLLARLSRKGRPAEAVSDFFRVSAGRKLSGAKELRAFLKEAAALFTVKEDPYWTHRYNFTSKKSSRSMTLIGESRASSILFNAVLPMMLLKARKEKDAALEEFIWNCVQAYPSLSDNVVTKFMRRRLFGDKELAKKFIFNERRQQALFKIFYDCCNNNEVTCEDCVFFRRSREMTS